MSPYIIAFFLLCTTNIKANKISSWVEWILDTMYPITYHVYSREKPSIPDVLTYGDEDALNKSTYELRNGTVIFIHGYLQSINTEHAQAIVNAYLQLMDCNVILVDWTILTSSLYFLVAAPNARTAGNYIANMIKWLEERNRLSISDLHIIGFSLGAQVAGFVGKSLEPQKIRRITGLDPAGPFFEGENSQNRLDKSDAKFVDIIHTSYLGVASPYGYADFYANYGKSHPHCWFIPCYHFRAAWYFIESISNPHKFVAQECQYNNQTLENCDQNATNTFMGHFADPQKHGVFLVTID